MKDWNGCAGPAQVSRDGVPRSEPIEHGATNGRRGESSEGHAARWVESLARSTEPQEPVVDQFLHLDLGGGESSQEFRGNLSDENQGRFNV